MNETNPDGEPMTVYLATDRAKILHTVPSPDPNRPDARIWDLSNELEPGGLNHHLTVTGTFQLWGQEFYAWAEYSAEGAFLEAFAAACPGARSSVTLFVHGFNRDFKGAVRGLESLGKGLSDAWYGGALLGFDWPSAGGVLLYAQDRARAEASVEPFYAHLLGLRSACDAWGARLNLVCHSMGNHLAALAGRTFLEQGGSSPIVDRMVMLAPDVTGHLFETDPGGGVRDSRGAGLCAMCSDISVFYSASDAALKASENLENPDDPRLGRVGPRRPLPGNVSSTDASKAPLRIRTHGGYLSGRAVALWSALLA
jgi:esterase/lipase superfamily enzyme